MLHNHKVTWQNQPLNFYLVFKISSRVDVLREQTGLCYLCEPTDFKQKGSLNSGCTKPTQIISSDQTRCQTMALSRSLTDTDKYLNVTYLFVCSWIVVAWLKYRVTPHYEDNRTIKSIYCINWGCNWRMTINSFSEE